MSTATTELLLVTGIDSASITAAEDAIQRRDTLLASARRGTSVRTADGAQRAAEIMREIKAFTGLIEATRKEVKAPVLEIGKKIDSVSNTLTADLQAEYDRISRLLGAYQAEERRKQEEAAQRAREEEQRLLEEAAAKQRAIDEEAQRKAEELEAKAAKARTDEKAAQYQAEADTIRANAEQAQRAVADKTADAIVDTRVSVETAAAARPSGLAVRGEIKFEVTNIQALYEAAPAFVILTPNNAALKAALKALPEGQSLPGVRHWTEQKASIRSARY